MFLSAWKWQGRLGQLKHVAHLPLMAADVQTHETIPRIIAYGIATNKTSSADN